MYKDRSVVTQLVKRAEKAGFKAIVLTVDTPRLGRRESDIKNRSNHRLQITNLPLFIASITELTCFLNVPSYRFVLPQNLSLKNFDGLNLGKLDKVNMILLYT